MRGLVMAWLMSASIAQAGLTLVLTPPAQPVAAGAETLFSGTLTNTSATDKLFLNDITAAFTADPQNDTALYSNEFFADVPGILLPGETYDGPLFRIALSSSSTAANYTGSVTFRGGADITADSPLANASITVLATPVDQWRHQTFGDSAGSSGAADSADWDHDGVSNLLEYALALDALTPDSSSQPAAMLMSDHLALSFVPTAADVAYTVEASTDLLQWGTADVEAVTLINPSPPNRLAFRFKNSLGQSARAFLRLKITRTNPGP